MSHVTTDIYPTRYAAFAAPGTPVVFAPREDGTFRHCHADAPYRHASFLGAWDGHNGTGEAAVCSDPPAAGVTYVELRGPLNPDVDHPTRPARTPGGNLSRTRRTPSPWILDVKVKDKDGFTRSHASQHPTREQAFKAFFAACGVAA